MQNVTKKLSFIIIFTTFWSVCSADNKTCEQICRDKQQEIYQSCLNEFAKNLCQGTALSAYNSCNNDCPDGKNS